MKCKSWRRGAGISWSLAAAAGVALSSSAHAFVFDFASSNGVDIVTHPKGYTGAGGNLNITVGIDMTSNHAAQMVIPTQNAVSVWNGLVPTTNNLVFGANNNIPSNAVDFESTLLHEMGHALGLDHPNLGSQTGVTGANSDYTNANRGADNAFDFNDGTDNVIGSRDDLRDDDVNLNYFRTSNNNPFTIAPIVDSTTYSRILTNLPSGSLFSANASRDVGALLGFTNTEASLQQGAFIDEAQRTLGHDDVAGIRYAEAGLDGIAGNADDYTFTLSYVGLTNSADILLDFDDNQTDFAVTAVSGQFIAANHVRVTSSPIFFADTGNNWFFNTVSLVPEPTSLGLIGMAAALLIRRKRA